MTEGNKFNCDVCGEEMDVNDAYLKGGLHDFLKGHKRCLMSYISEEDKKEDD